MHRFIYILLITLTFVGPLAQPHHATANNLFVYPANTGAHKVSVIDVAQQKVVTNAPVGEDPGRVLPNRMGRFVYIGNKGDHATTQQSASDSHQMHKDKEHPTKAPPIAKLGPAEGASVKILSPKPGQTFKGDEVPLQFKLVKGKRGHHVHAYVDNDLMGMFESEKGTLTGIKPGSHVLELRVVAKDHQTELDARDRVKFVVK